MSLDIGLDINRIGPGLAALMSRFPGAAMAADFTKGLYYADGAKSLGQLLTNVPAGQPTVCGLHVTAGDQPLMVQGRGPELWSNPVPWIANHLGSLGAYDLATQIMSVPGNGGNNSHPRFAFGGMVTTGRTYQVSGRVSGHIADVKIRLATVGGALATVDPVTGEFSSILIAEDDVVQFITNGPAGPWSTQIEEISVREVTPFAGYTPASPELTFAVEWAGVPALTGTSRGLLELRFNAGFGIERAYLFIESGNQVKLGVADSIAWRSGPAFGAGVYDDGLRHKAVCYLNRVSGDLKLTVDGAAPITANKMGQMPSGFSSLSLGHGHNINHATGAIRLAAAVSGDKFDVWR